ncbi:MAG TPA: RagB/SusD family nutrient uptake outer membrane protein, partial [Puia sp.]
DIGRATSGAAKGMLARVLIWEKKFTDAAPLLQSIITTQSPGNYDLLPYYADIFRSANGNNKEILFAIQFAPNSQALGESGNPVTNFNPGVVSPNVGYTGTNADQPTQDLYDLYPAGDLRRDANIGYATVAGVPVAYCAKYITPSITVIAENGADYPVLRYADILLMYAECLNEGGGPAAALPYINKVRERAYGGSSTSDLQMTDAATTATYVADQAAMRDRIMDERRMEFAFEGLRFFDLVRTNRLASVMNAYFIKYNLRLNGTVISVGDNNKLFPVPLAQINLNPGKITQNLGY